MIEKTVRETHKPRHNQFVLSHKLTRPQWMRNANAYWNCMRLTNFLWQLCRMALDITLPMWIIWAISNDLSMANRKCFAILLYWREQAYCTHTHTRNQCRIKFCMKITLSIFLSFSHSPPRFQSWLSKMKKSHCACLIPETKAIIYRTIRPSSIDTSSAPR